MTHRFNDARVAAKWLLAAACLLAAFGCGPRSFYDTEGKWSMQYDLSLDECDTSRSLAVTSTIECQGETRFTWKLFGAPGLGCELDGLDFECEYSEPDMMTSLRDSLTGSFSEDFSEASGDFASYFSVFDTYDEFSGYKEGYTCNAEGTFNAEYED